MKKTDFNFDIAKFEQLFYSNLREKDKRLFVALEAMKIGYYGVDEVATKYHIHKHTVRKGQKELVSGNLVAVDMIRRKGGGRKKKS